jgi:hypothetical protein
MFTIGDDAFEDVDARGVDERADRLNIVSLRCEFARNADDFEDGRGRRKLQIGFTRFT